MKKYGCDILNLEWSSRGRDIDIVEPVLSYLEREYGLTVVRDSIFNAGAKLTRYRPRMFLIADQGGASLNFRAVRLAARLGIPVVTLRSEGVMPDEPGPFVRQFWGWNSEQRMYETLHLEWSQHNIDLTHKYIPGSAAWDMRVSGATGFDRYRLASFETRDEFLRRRGLGYYDRIVGLAGWTFSHVVGRYYDSHADIVNDYIGVDGVGFHREALPLLRSEYRRLVDSHPRTLFVARMHPGETEEECSEFTELEGLSNVVFSRRSEDNIDDLISASDLWVAYESTTALEAWLLNKRTVLLNPHGGEFKRAPIAKGSPIVSTADEVTAMLEEIDGGSVPVAFAALAEVRNQLVDSTIGYSDGRNHVRAAEQVMSVWDRPRPPRDIDAASKRELAASLRVDVLSRVGLGPLSSAYRSGKNLRERFDAAERAAAASAYHDAMDRFHA